MPLPASERILLGPGPSLIPPRVMRALAAPVLSHLDPDFVPLLDEVRGLLRMVFRADDEALTLATSGTGTSAMEAAVANAVSRAIGVRMRDLPLTHDRIRAAAMAG